MPTPAPAVVEIVVADLAATLAFYRDLGLDVPDDADPAAPHLEIPFGGLRLAFDTEETIRSFDPERHLGPGGGRVALALDCGSPDAVDAHHARLVAAGHRSHLAPFDAVWGQRYAAVLDPDGVSIDLFAAAGAGAAG